METRQEKRVKKTKKELKEALIYYLKIKNINSIQVKELTEYCDLNRGTFYIHYTDIFDMVEQIENELLNEFIETLNRYPANSKECDELIQLLLDLFHWIEKNKEIAGALLGENGNVSFYNQLKIELKKTCISHWNVLFDESNKKYYDLYFNYLVSGCFGIIQEWLNNEINLSADELAYATSRMIKDGVNILKS